MFQRSHMRAKSFSAALPLKFLYASRSLLMSSIIEDAGAVSVSPAWDFRRSLMISPRSDCMTCRKSSFLTVYSKDDVRFTFKNGLEVKM